MRAARIDDKYLYLVHNGGEYGYVSLWNNICFCKNINEINKNNEIKTHDEKHNTFLYDDNFFITINIIELLQVMYEILCFEFILIFICFVIGLNFDLLTI